MNRARRRRLRLARLERSEAVPDIPPAVRTYLSEIGRQGGKVGGKPTGRKGFAAIPPKRFAEICAKAAEARRQKAEERRQAQNS